MFPLLCLNINVNFLKSVCWNVAERTLNGANSSPFFVCVNCGGAPKALIFIFIFGIFWKFPEEEMCRKEDVLLESNLYHHVQTVFFCLRQSQRKLDNRKEKHQTHWPNGDITTTKFDLFLCSDSHATTKSNPMLTSNSCPSNPHSSLLLFSRMFQVSFHLLFLRYNTVARVFPKLVNNSQNLDINLNWGTTSFNYFWREVWQLIEAKGC